MRTFAFVWFESGALKVSSKAYSSVRLSPIERMRSGKPSAGRATIAVAASMEIHLPDMRETYVGVAGNPPWRGGRNARWNRASRIAGSG
ncbi:hypothetical protein llg_30340 [Luteolibacter sp. LG18]|nr:hypothetical protein llg_30340 [Luteolibacter sp. LG18]